MLTLSATSAAAGSPVTLTATTAAGQTPIALGQITFNYQETINGVVNTGSFGSYQLTSAGSAISVIVPGVGTYQITASFAGTSLGAPSSSQPQTLTITGTGSYTTETQFVPTGTPGNYTLAAQVGVFGLVPPTGAVSFVDNTGGSVGVASATLQATPVGYGLIAGANSPLVDGNTEVLYVATGDLNHDGVADIVSLDFDGSTSDPGTVQVRLGLGNGLFANPVSYALNVGQLNNVIIADVNHDGKPDLIVVSSELTGYDTQNQRIFILLGNGDGTFQVPANPSPQVLITGNGPNYLAAVDLNGDGNLDLVVTNRADYTVIVFLGDGTGAFTEQNASPFSSAGTAPYGVIVEDFNGDGIPDLAVTNAGGTQTNAFGSVAIFLGAGDGSFTFQNSYTTPGNAAPPAAGSLRNNGVLDLVVPDGNNNAIYVYLGNGDGTFASAPITLPTSNSPFSVLLVDENHDGKLDIVAAIYGFFSASGTSDVALLLGNGDGTFGAEQDFSTGSAGINNVAMGDLNNDGLTDFVTSNFASTFPGQGTVSLLLADQYVTASIANISVPGPGPQAIDASYAGDSTHTASASTATPLLPIVTTIVLSAVPNSVPSGSPLTLTATVASTLDGPASGGTVSFYSGSTLLGTANVLAGSASFTTSSLPSGYTGVVGIYSGTSVLGTSTSSTLRVFAGSQSATKLAVSASTAVAGTPIVLTASTANSPGGSPLEPGQVSFNYQQTVGGAIESGSFGTAQLTSGGTAALTLQPSAGTYLITATFLGTSATGPSSSAPQTVTITVGASFGSLTTLQSGGTVGDYSLAATVSGFGLAAPSGTISFLDASNSNASVAVATIDPSTIAYMPLSAAGSPINGPAVQAVTTGDINGDGIVDLVSSVCNDGSGGVNVQLGNGDGSFQMATFYQTGTCALAAAIADVNGDGVPDLVVVNSVDSTVSILLGGGGTFAPQPNLQIANGGQPIALAVADLNHDGVLDIVVANSQEADASVFLGKGDGTFDVEQTYATGPGGSALTVTDLNQDGNLDLLVSNANDGTISVLLGVGDGTFKTQSTFSVTYAQYGDFTTTLATGSLRNNGVTDLVTTDDFGGAAYVYLGNNNGTFAAPVTVNLINGTPDNAILADVNHDGKLDLVVIYVGQIGIFYGKGDGSFGQENDFNTGQAQAGGQGYISVVAADLNNDGLVDFITVDTVNYSEAILLGQQSATATANAVYVLGTGPQSVDASFPGDSTHAASVSVPVTLQPSAQSASNVSLATPNANIVTGSVVTFTATVTPTPTGANYGTVSFYTGAVLLGVQPVNASGIATYSTSSLPLGTDTITAVYSGNADEAPSTSAALSISNRAATLVAFSANPTTQLYNNPIVLTAQATSPVAGTLTGTVTFLDGSTVLATVAVGANGQATYSVATLADGSHSLTAAYSGDTNYLPSASTGAAVAITVGDLNLDLGDDQNKSVVPGGAVAYAFPLSPLVTPTFIYDVHLTATGLPPGATYIFSPATIPAGSASLPVTLTVQTAKAAASLSLPVTPGRGNSSRGLTALVFGLLLPLFGARSVRKRLKALPTALAMVLFAVFTLGTMIGLSGCGGGGFFGPTATSGKYTITVTATSADLVRTSTVELTIQ